MRISIYVNAIVVQTAHASALLLNVVIDVDFASIFCSVLLCSYYLVYWPWRKGHG